MKKLIAFLLAILVTLPMISICATAADADITETAFVGTRSVTLIIDCSDLNNYFNGGRAYFDFLLRRNAPDWLTYSIAANQRDISIKMQFEFASFDEYCGRVSELLAATPYISYHNDGKLLLLESHRASELLNFVTMAANATIAYEEVDVADLFSVSENSISINELTYTGDRKLEIFPEGEEIIPLRHLSIQTVCEDNLFHRTLITAPKDEEQRDTLIKRFKKAGDVEGEEGDIRVSFTAANLVDLNRITTLCLYASCNVLEQEAPITDEDGRTSLMVQVTQTEVFNLDTVLENPSDFSYEFTHPAYYSEVVPAEEQVSLEEGKLSARSRYTIAYTYTRQFRFSELSVVTDLTNVLGKVKKIIRFKAPQVRAQPLHDALKQHLSECVKDGVLLNIYDEGAMRCYELTYASFFQDDVLDFAKDVLGDDYECEIADSWIPYGSSTITETVNSYTLSVLEIPPVKTTVVYQFPSLSSYDQTGGDGNMQEATDTKAVTITLEGDGTVEMTYHRFQILKCIVVGGGLLVVLIAVLLVVKWYKNPERKRKLEERKQEKAAIKAAAVQAAKEAAEQAAKETGEDKIESAVEKVEESTAGMKIEVKDTVQVELVAKAPAFCWQCGAPVDGDSAFCRKCGARIQ